MLDAVNDLIDYAEQSLLELMSLMRSFQDFVSENNVSRETIRE